MASESPHDIPFELKPLAPFLQRAQELKVKDPTMSYWCTYYAVQQGVHLKPREKLSRNYLMKLMMPLEAIRNDPSTKVVTNNDTAAIYIEDFALRVFDAADNEDRRAEASRGTAKKFLAAANFLELLKVFEESGVSGPSSSNDLGENGNASAFSQHKDKIRYAKWKAGDIAKAFREGRRPVPGPANAPESMRRGAVTSPGPEAPYGQPGPNPSQAAFPFESMSPNAGQAQFARESSSKSSSNAVSPVPGGSRAASMSPRHRNGILPMTSANESDYPNGRFSPTNSGFMNTIKPLGRPSSPLIREQASSPTTSGFGQQMPRPQSFGYEPAPRPGVPAPPRDFLATPGKPSNSSLYVATPNKNGVSPGGWSSVATPGGYDEKRAVDQSSPSRVPNGVKRIENGETSSYPPRPYPATPAFKAAKLAGDVDSDEENWKTRQEMPGRQQSFATNTTAGNMSRQGSYLTASDRKNSSDASNGAGGKLPTIQDDSGKQGEDADGLGPLNSSDKTPRKTVRWTPSVIGGSSTVASSSPPSSPGSPLGALPSLPASGSPEVRFTAHGISPPTSNDELPTKVPKNPYAESPWPARTTLPKITSPLPPNGLLPPPATNSSQNSSAQSTPTLPQQSLVRRSPPISQPGSAKNTPLPTPTSSTMNVPPPPVAFPSSSTGSSTSNAPFIPPSIAQSRHRRASSDAPQPLSSLHPSIRPLVPRFTPTSADTSPSTSAIVPSTTLTLGRPRNGYSPAASPPNKNLTPPSSSALVTRPLPTSLEYHAMSAAKRHAKFASSALEFEDLETARRELMAALAVLNGERAN